MDFISRSIVGSLTALPAPTINYLGSSSSTVATTTAPFTVPARVTTQPRLYVCLMASAADTRTITSVTFGGLNMTTSRYIDSAGADNNFVAIAYLYTATDLTGARNLVVTLSGTDNTSFTMYAVDNIISGTPIATVTDAGATNPVTNVVTTAVRGVAFGVFGTSGNDAHDAPTWTGMTQVQGFLVNTRASIHASTITNSASTTFSLSEANLIANTNRALMYVSFR